MSELSDRIKAKMGLAKKTVSTTETEKGPVRLGPPPDKPLEEMTPQELQHAFAKGKKKDKKEKLPPPPPKQKVKYICGHEEFLNQFKNQFCRACLRGNALRRRLAKCDKGNANRHIRERDKPRLPGGSKFEVDYNAEKQEWTGCLDVQISEDGKRKLFQGSSNGVFYLLEKLDNTYRAWLKEQETQTEVNNGS